MVVVFLDFIFDEIFLFFTSERNVIISNKYSMYKLPHKIPKRLKNYDYRKL